MKGWKTYKLEDAVDKLIDYRGKTPQKTTSGIPLVTAKVIKAGRIETPNEFIAEEMYDEWMTRGIPEYGDVVLTTEAPLGEVAQIRTTEKIALAQRVITLRGKKNLIDSTYLKYFLQSPIGQENLKAKETGSTVTGIKQSELRQIEIYAPDFKTQDSIASILSSLDNKIELNLQMNQTLEAMAHAIFKEWFVNFNFPGFGGKLVNGLPKGWKMGTISEIYKTTSGGTPSRAKDEFYKDGKVKWVKSKELNGSFIFDTEEKITDDAVKNSSAKKVPRHSVLIAMYGATVGEYGVLSSEATCNQAICAIIPNDNYPYSYILEYIKINKEKIIDQASGSAQQNISQALIQRQEILIPPSEIVKSFHQIVDKLFERIESNLFSNQILAQTRDSLLPNLIAGKLEVKA